MSGIASPSRRDMLFGGLAAAAAGTAFARMPHKRLMLIRDGALEKMVPTKIGSWNYDSSSGIVQPPPDQLVQALYSQQVARTYAAPDQLPVMLMMAYGSSQSGMLQVHRPEICYPASGFALTETEASTLPLIHGGIVPVRQFTAHSDTRVEHVLYWTRIGNLLPISWTSQRLAIMQSNLEGYVPDGLLVRISVVSQNMAQADAMVRLFARTLLEEIGPTGRRMLVGNDHV